MGCWPLLDCGKLTCSLGDQLKKYLLPFSIVALLLSGCASEAADATADAKPESQVSTTPTETPVDAMGPGTYTFDTGAGTVGTLEVPGTAPVDIEEVRTLVGGEPVTYLTGNLDNREGAELFDMYRVSIYDMEGNKYDYEPAEDYMHSTVSIDAPDDVYDKYRAASDNLTSVFDPLQQGDFVMVGPLLPEQIAGVNVSNGFEDFGAQPAG